MTIFQYSKILSGLIGFTLASSCTSTKSFQVPLSAVPEIDNYCLTAQSVVTNTSIPMQLVIHDDFNAFVKSKAVIEGPTIHQFNWYGANGEVLGISCKLKSADHLNLVFGEYAAGPDGKCQKMNRSVFQLLTSGNTGARFNRVIFDPNETVSNPDNPGMTGPDWLAPYTMDYQENDELHIATKGFIVNFTDQRYAKAPERFRGVHYCHFIAPDRLSALLFGDAEPGARIGQLVAADFPSSAPQFE